MVKFLARFWRWLKNKFFPSPPPVPKPTVTKPSNLEYENALLELLEEAAKGKTWGNLQGILITGYSSRKPPIFRGQMKASRRLKASCVLVHKILLCSGMFTLGSLV